MGEVNADPLLALARDADALEPPQPGEPARPVALTPDAKRQQWIDTALKFGAMAREAHPLCKEHWTEESLTALGVALADCAQKYNWSAPAAVVAHPLVSLAMASTVLAWPFVGAALLGWLSRLINRLLGGQPAAPTPTPTPAKPAPKADGGAPDLSLFTGKHE